MVILEKEGKQIKAIGMWAVKDPQKNVVSILAGSCHSHEFFQGAEYINTELCEESGEYFDTYRLEPGVKITHPDL